MLSHAWLLLIPVHVDGADQAFQDPAPPVVHVLEPLAAPLAKAIPELKIHAAPRALAADAIVEDWPSFLGPRRDGRCVEHPLATDFGAQGPTLLWEMQRAEGYASPVIAEGRLVFTQRAGDEVHVDCLEPDTGKRYWRYTYPCGYKGKYIENSGPRATPAIADGHVYIHGVDGVLFCLELETGRLLWRRDTTREFKLDHGFFGIVASPLVVGDFLVQNVGAPGGPCVVAFRRDNGALAWGAGSMWGPSCASPVLAHMHGEPRLFVITGGESRPPTGGLMVIDPEDGEVTCEYPFRSRTFTSVNGASPLICEERVFLTAAYGVGSAVLDIDGSGAGTELWKKRRGLASEFSTPVYEGGRVYAISGVSGRTGAITAIDPASGEELAYEHMTLSAIFTEGEQEVEIETSVGAGSLLYADGVFLVLGDTGYLASVRVQEDKFQVTSEAALFHAPETWTPPVISHGLLYICQNNPASVGDEPARLLCYDLRK
ncbi:MAG: outer membrane protein assembly factor BamB [Chlamydiales bacterium]|jgi:outer membrane protein assembly factor BamB